MIIRQLIVLALAYVSLVLQSSVGAMLEIQGHRPWFAGIAIVAIVVLDGDSTGIVWSAILGLGVDGISGDRLGINVVAAVSMAAAITLIRQNHRSIGLIGTSFYVCCGTLLWRLFTPMISGLFAKQNLDFDHVLNSAVGDSAYTVMVALFLLMIGRAVTNSVLPPQAGPTMSLTNRWLMLTR